MPIDRDKNKQLKVTIPNDLHRKLKIISEKIGIPMAQMLLQSAVEKYRDELKELDKEESSD
jgi:predicted DNA-binding protein